MQQEELEELMLETKILMEGAIEHFHAELIKVRAGKASPDMLSGLRVNYYGAPTPIKQVANIAVSDSRTLVIQPYEKNLIGDIERSIFEANLGVTPQNDGEVIRIIIPPLTEERRRDLVKRVKSLGEESKVGVRSARHSGMDKIRKAVKAGELPEDNGKRREQQIQDMTDSFSKKIDEMISNKEKDIMTI